MREFFLKARSGIVLAVILFSMLACLITVPATTPVATPPPTLTLTPIPLYAQVTLASIPRHEEGQLPNFTLDLQTPQLEGSNDGRAINFNTLMRVVVQEEEDMFRGMVANLPVEPIAGGSFLDISFIQLAPYGNLISIRFSIIFNSDGAAHPGHYSRTLTYDLEGGLEVTLEHLFLPGVDYLTPISGYCIAALRQRDFGLDDSWLGGASPIVENYRNWNVTGDGLLITFDEYQVAPYAAGPQEVVIPYTEIAGILDPSGPLAEILP